MRRLEVHKSRVTALCVDARNEFVGSSSDDGSVAVRRRGGGTPRARSAIGSRSLRALSACAETRVSSTSYSRLRPAAHGRLVACGLIELPHATLSLWRIPACVCLTRGGGATTAGLQVTGLCSEEQFTYQYGDPVKVRAPVARVHRGVTCAEQG